jgi:hypothetical protein
LDLLFDFAEKVLIFLPISLGYAMIGKKGGILYGKRTVVCGVICSDGAGKD